MLLPFIIAATVLSSTDLAKAPPSFPYSNSKAVFVDFEETELTWEFNISARSNTAKAKILFKAGESGFPIFDLIPTPSNVTLNGEAVQAPTASIQGVTTARILSKEVAAGSFNTLELTYSIPSSFITYTSGAVRFGTFMGDLSDRGFFEKYAPTNFEFDQYRQAINVKLIGAAAEHRMYTNGTVYPLGSSDFRVIFPAFYTTSSFYFHIAERGRFAERVFTYTGVSFDLPVVVYAESVANASAGETRTRSILRELESTYGFFGHDTLTVYVTPSGGGMEYGGATMTSLGALGHELTHSYFARGVMPANGNAGWIDEAIASWRDSGYPRRTNGFSNSPINLAGFSAYKRFTTQLAYSSGMQFISYLDGILKDVGGMKEMLTLLWIEKRRQTITTPMFQAFLEDKSGKDLDTVFDFYVYGQRDFKFRQVLEPVMRVRDQHRPYSQEELVRFR